MAKTGTGIPKEAKAIVTELYKSGITDIGILANESGLTENQVKQIISKYDKKTSKEIPEGEASAPIDESQTLLEILKQAAPNNKRVGSAVDMFMRFGDLDDLGKLRYVLELSGFKPNEQKIALLRWALHRGLPIPKDIKQEIDRFKVELPDEDKKKLEMVDEDYIDKLIEERAKRLRKMQMLKELEMLEKELYGKKDDDEKPKKKRKKVPLIGPDGDIVTTPDGKPIVIETDDVMPYLYMMLMQKNKREDNDFDTQQNYDPRIDMLKDRISRLEHNMNKISDILNKIAEKIQNSEPKHDDKEDKIMTKLLELEKKFIEMQYKKDLEIQKKEFEMQLKKQEMLIEQLRSNLTNNKDPLAEEIRKEFDILQNELKQLKEENMLLKQEKERKALEERFSKLENSIAYLAQVLQNNTGAKSEVEIVAKHQSELVDKFISSIKEAGNTLLSPFAEAVVSNQRLQNIINLAALEQRLGYPKGTLIRLYSSPFAVAEVATNINENENELSIITASNTVQSNTSENNVNINSTKQSKIKKAFDNVIRS